MFQKHLSNIYLDEEQNVALDSSCKSVLNIALLFSGLKCAFPNLICAFRSLYLICNLLSNMRASIKSILCIYF